MYSYVTVPLDLSPSADRALPAATELAKAFGATLELVTLIGAGMDSEPDRRRLVKRAAAIPGVPTTVRVIESLDLGRTLTGLGARADRVLCMSTRGRSGLSQIVLGSVAAEVTHDATAPLVLVGPQAHIQPGHPFSTLVVCVDGGECVPDLAGIVSTLSVGLGAEVHVVTVDAGDGMAPWYAHDRVERLCAALRELGCSSEPSVLMRRDPTRALMEYASQWASPLVVVGNRQRGKIARNALGSVSASLVQQSPAPVLVVPSRTRRPSSTIGPDAAADSRSHQNATPSHSSIATGIRR
jgi:nucleotide-binding universal stress UspA family protein